MNKLSRKLFYLKLKGEKVYNSDGLFSLLAKGIKFISRKLDPRNFRSRLHSTIAPRVGSNTIRNPLDDIERLSYSNSPTIVDGGANRGQTIEEFQSRFQEPKIHAFEPDERAFRKLKKGFSHLSNLNIYQQALGASNEKININMTEDTTKSSILNPIDRNKQINENLQKSESANNLQKEISQQTKVEQVRLDNKLESVDILKLDLQGYELEALKGSRKILEDCKIVFLEVFFEEIYEGNAMYWEVDKFLRKNGFVIYNYYDLYTRLNGNISGGDGIYLNRDYYDLTSKTLKKD
jgi:FkbM family methyltransferase